jgi:hypothetical protein
MVWALKINWRLQPVLDKVQRVDQHLIGELVDAHGVVLVVVQESLFVEVGHVLQVYDFLGEHQHEGPGIVLVRPTQPVNLLARFQSKLQQ